MFNRKWYQASKLEIEFHMINITYAALHMRAQTEKTTFSCKDDCTLTKHTERWTYSTLWYFFKTGQNVARKCLGIMPKEKNIYRGNASGDNVCYVLALSVPLPHPQHISSFPVFVKNDHYLSLSIEGATILKTLFEYCLVLWKALYDWNFLTFSNSPKLKFL